jgi:hypothetical protein
MLLGAGVFSVDALLSKVCCVFVRLLGGSFAFFVWPFTVAKKQMCHPMRWLMCS